MKKFNIELIQNFMKERNLTIKGFCKLCNITYYNYHQLMHHDFNLTIPKLMNVINAMKIESIYTLVLVSKD